VADATAKVREALEKAIAESEADQPAYWVSLRIEDARALLARAVPEADGVKPVAWLMQWMGSGSYVELEENIDANDSGDVRHKGIPLYAHPPVPPAPEPLGRDVDTVVNEVYKTAERILGRAGQMESEYARAIVEDARAIRRLALEAVKLWNPAPVPPAVSEAMAREAMQSVWDDFCTDTGRNGRRRTERWLASRCRAGVWDGG
jgi:hypothetical protein